MTESDVQRLLALPGMIRSAGKVRAIVANARSFLRIVEEWGTFDRYLWHFTEGRTLLYRSHIEDGQVPTSNKLSHCVATDLRRRGFAYVGPVIVYSHLQGVGVICDHSATCPCLHQIMQSQPTRWVDE